MESVYGTNSAPPGSPNIDQIPPDLTSCMDRLLKIDLDQDIEFVVGPEESSTTFKAHKIILASRSPVFYAMFYGLMKDLSCVIQLPDCSPEAFGYALRYMYTDKMDSIPIEQLMKCLYVGTKYQLTGFIKNIEYMCTTKVTSDHVCNLLQEAIDMCHEDLINHFISYMSAKAEHVLPTPSFKNCSRHILDAVICRDNLIVSNEMSVFNALLEWGNSRCKEQNIETTPENRKEVLGNLIYEVRYNFITPMELSRYVAPTGLLSNEELVALFLHFHTNKEVPLPEKLNHIPREKALVQRNYLCLQSIKTRSRKIL